MERRKLLVALAGLKSRPHVCSEVSARTANSDHLRRLNMYVAGPGAAGIAGAEKEQH
jgi:hypothetical protein